MFLHGPAKLLSHNSGKAELLLQTLLAAQSLTFTVNWPFEKKSVNPSSGQKALRDITKYNV